MPQASFILLAAQQKKRLRTVPLACRNGHLRQFGYPGRLYFLPRLIIKASLTAPH
jgi:hypothetical protein